jgi:hypothetical protein
MKGDCVVIGLGVEGGTARQISKVLGCGSSDVGELFMLLGIKSFQCIGVAESAR